MKLTNKTRLGYINNTWVLISNHNKIRELEQSKAFKLVLIAKNKKVI